MKRGQSYLWAILLLALTCALILTAAKTYHQATRPDLSGMELLIEADREHFRSMQPVWDKMEDENPEFVRPKPTTEAEYQRWRESDRKGK